MPDTTDKGNFKELNDQVTRFVIENGQYRPKGPFLNDCGKRSFLEKYYYTVFNKAWESEEMKWLDNFILYNFITTFYWISQRTNIGLKYPLCRIILQYNDFINDADIFHLYPLPIYEGCVSAIQAVLLS